MNYQGLIKSKPNSSIGYEILNNIQDPHSYYLNKEEPNKSCLLALRSIILDQDKEITETQKWGMPCFCYKKKMFCYSGIDHMTCIYYDMSGKKILIEKILTEINTNVIHLTMANCAANK